MFTLMVVESLFSWLDTFSALLCGIGFLLLWHLTGTRGTNIVTTKHRTLTLVLGVVLLLNCFFGLLREATWLFEILVGVTGLCILVVLYPAWFIMLGLVRKDCSAGHTSCRSLRPIQHPPLIRADFAPNAGLWQSRLAREDDGTDRRQLRGHDRCESCRCHYTRIGLRLCHSCLRRESLVPRKHVNSFPRDRG
eukprot:SAG31_NODE_1180_length_9525_cov_4.989497_2_plen_193_part_00